MLLDMIAITMCTYILNTVYIGFIGYLIGEGVEKTHRLIKISEEQKTELAKKQATFIAIHCKYAFLLFPSLFMAMCYEGIHDVSLVWAFAYISTVLLQMLIQELYQYFKD